MESVLYVLVVVLSFAGMEGVAWLAHKYLMHGLLWSLHEDHHKKTPRFFEKNDFFFLIFASPSIACLLVGVTLHLAIPFCIGIGILIYGLAYFLVHDVIIHQRFKWFSRSSHPYIKAIRRAHKMHHKHLEKHDGESFGMLYASKKYWEYTRQTANRERGGRHEPI